MRITDKERQAFVEMLRRARESRGWKQYEAASIMGLPVSTLSRLEHGPYDGMRFEDVVMVCRAYGIPLDAVAGLLGLPASEGVADAEVEALLASVRALEPERLAFVSRVLQTVLRGL